MNLHKYHFEDIILFNVVSCMAKISDNKCVQSRILLISLDLRISPSQISSVPNTIKKELDGQKISFRHTLIQKGKKHPQSRYYMSPDTYLSLLKCFLCKITCVIEGVCVHENYIKQQAWKRTGLDHCTWSQFPVTERY